MASSSDSVNLDDTLDNTLNNKNNTPCNEADGKKLFSSDDIFLELFFKKPISNTPFKTGMVLGFAGGLTVAVCISLLAVFLLVIISYLT